MRRVLRCAAWALLLLPAIPGAAIAQPDARGEERQVREMLEDFAAALEARDLDAALGYFSPAFKEWCDDKARVAATLGGLFAANAHLSVQLMNISVAARGNNATANFHVVITGDAGVIADSDINADDPAFFHFLRREHGRWKFYGSQLSPPEQPDPPPLGLPVADLAACDNIHAFITPARALVPSEAHNGLDFRYPASGFQFIAAAAGRVKRVTFDAAPPAGYPYSRYEVAVSYNCNYDFVYIFEPFAIVSEAELRAAVLVKRGDALARDQVIGSLIRGGPGAHVHFGVRQNGNWVCPGHYFDPATRAAIQAQYEATGFASDLLHYPMLCNE
jgi:ketosteroid isomerase-like protein